MLIDNSNISIRINSLPCELLIKLVYYLDKDSIIHFNIICQYIKNYNFCKLLLPYKILYMYDLKDNIEKHSLEYWFKNEMNPVYINKDIIYYIKDLKYILDNVIIQNVGKRIHRPGHILYNILSFNIHRNLRRTFMVNETELINNIKYTETRLHIIFRINRFTYTYMRKNHLTVLALMY